MADSRNTIRIDSVGADKVKRDFLEITAASDKAADGFKKTGDAASKAGDGVEKLGRNARDYGTHAKVASTSTDALNVGLATLARYASAGALLELGRRTIMAADTFKGLQNQLRTAGLESDALATATDKLFEVSKRTGTSVEANATLYARLSAAQKDLGATSGQLFTFTEAVANALKINGTEASAASGALLQLSQAMGGAKIQAQEYNSLIDGMRPLLQAVANNIDAAGGSVAKLTTLVKDGSVSTKEFFDAAMLGAEELSQQAEKAQTRIGQSVENLKTNYIEAAGKSEALTAATGLTTEAIGLLGGTMKTVFAQIDEDAKPLIAVATALGEIAKFSAEIGDKSPAVKGFFETALDAAQKAVNPFKAISDSLGVIGGFLDKYGSFGKGKVGSVGFQPGATDLSGLPANNDFNPLSTYNQDRAASPSRANRYGLAPTDAEIAKAKAQRDKAAKDLEDWENKKAEGWRELNERFTDAWADTTEKIASDARDAEEAIKSIDKAMQDNIETVKFETEMIGLSNQAKEKAIALRNAQKSGARPEDVAALGEAIDAQQAKQAAQDAADEVQAVWDKARDDFSDSWSDLFYGIFNDGKFRFKDLADSFKSIWARTLADLLTMSLQDSFIKPMFAGLMGGTGGTGSTGAAGTMDIFKLFGGGSKAAGAAGASGGALGALGTIGSGIAGIGLALGIGKMGGSATGGLVGSTMLGAAGSVLGTLGILGAAAGPIGAVVGAILGGVMGGLMKPSPRSSSSVTTSGSGVLGVGDSYALGLDIKIGQDMANGVIRALRAFSDQLVTGLENDAFLGIVGQRGKKFFFQAQESDLKTAGKSKNGAVKFKEAEDAIAYAIEAAINSGVVKGLTDSDKKLMRAATSVEQAMQDVVSSHNFKRELGFQFTGLSNPLAEAQARLEFEYQQQLILAEKYEADKTQLEAVYAQKRLDLVEQYNLQQYASLKSFLTSITAGSASPLSPTTRLGLAQANYSALSGKARAGDQDAIAALQGAAQDYLSAGKDVFASGGGYQSIYQQVVGDLSAITGVANPLGVGAASNQNVAAAVNDNTRAQAGWFTQAAAQRTATNSKLDTLNTNVSALVTALSRGMATPTQNGTVTVGTVDWASVTQAVASLRG